MSTPVSESEGVAKLRLTTKFAPVYIPLDLIDALCRVLYFEYIEPWLQTNNSAFDNRTPLQVIGAGEAALLYNMVNDIEYDSF